jgi:cytochrome P450 family 628
MRQVLSNMLYFLKQNPHHLAHVREELDSINIRDYKALQHLVHLNACIYETLRLNPAVPSSGLRIAPRGGLAVNGKYIPEGTTVVVPQYSLFRGKFGSHPDLRRIGFNDSLDERNFVHPGEWIPERFSTQPDLILNDQAFTPWNTGTLSTYSRPPGPCLLIETLGRYACLGKNLSLMEIRVAAALIFTSLDFDLAPGEDGQRMFTEACDYFTTSPGPLYLVMKNRE